MQFKKTFKEFSATPRQAITVPAAAEKQVVKQEQENKSVIPALPVNPVQDKISTVKKSGNFRDMILSVQLSTHGPRDQDNDNYNPIKCSYQGRSRPIHPKVCEWHRDMRDVNCHQCERYS